MSLTKEEQWEIIQKEWKRTGRGGKKKKMEVYEEMDAFGPNQERSERWDLEATETLPPFKYSLDWPQEGEDSQPHPNHQMDGAPDDEQSYEKTAFWKLNRHRFHSWFHEAQQPGSWMKLGDYRSYCRFALRRPLMPERLLWEITGAMGIDLEKVMGIITPANMSSFYTHGIDLREGQRHVSSRLWRKLPRRNFPLHWEEVPLKRVETQALRGRIEKQIAKKKAAATRANEKAHSTQKDEISGEQSPAEKLWLIYEHTREGRIPLDEAPQHYRAVFNIPSLPNESLIMALQRYGVPVDQIPTNDQSARRGSVPEQSDFDESEISSDPQIGGLDDTSFRNILFSVANQIQLFRSCVDGFFETIPEIRSLLGNVPIEDDEIVDPLCSENLSPFEAAKAIWDLAGLATPPSISAGSSTTENENLAAQTRGQIREDVSPGEADHVVAVQKRDSTIEKVPETEIANESFEEHLGAAESSMDNGTVSRITLYPSVEDLQPENAAESAVADRNPAPFKAPASPVSMKPPQLSRSPGHVGKINKQQASRELGSKSQRSGTPLPNLVAPVAVSSRSSAEDTVTAERRGFPSSSEIAELSTSPEEGVTKALWGLAMPTRQARKTGRKLGLPTDYVETRLYSHTPARYASKKLRRKINNVIFHKRQGTTIQQGESPRKMVDHGYHWDLFARDGESSESFVMSHFRPKRTVRRNPDDVKASNRVEGDHSVNYKAVVPDDESSSICNSVESDEDKSWEDINSGEDEEKKVEADKKANANTNAGDGQTSLSGSGPASDVKGITLGNLDPANRTDLNQHQQSTGLIAYLSRVSEDDNILISLRQAEERPVYAEDQDAWGELLNMIRKGITSGELRGPMRGEDAQAAAIIIRHAYTSQILPHDHSYIISVLRESIKADDGDQSRDAQQSMNLGSGLLNSGFGIPEIHDSSSLSDPVQRENAASEFSPYANVSTSAQEPQDGTRSQSQLRSPPMTQLNRQGRKSAEGVEEIADDKNHDLDQEVVSEPCPMKATPARENVHSGLNTPLKTPRRRFLRSPKPPPRVLPGTPSPVSQELPPTPRLESKKLPTSAHGAAQSSSESLGFGFANLAAWPPKLQANDSLEAMSATAQSCLNDRTDRFDTLPDFALPLPLEMVGKTGPLAHGKAGWANYPRGDKADKTSPLAGKTKPFQRFKPNKTSPLESSKARKTRNLAQGNAKKTRLAQEEAEEHWSEKTCGFQEALEHAREEALEQRKSYFVYIAERRAIRTRLNNSARYTANLESSGLRFFQSANGSSNPTSATTILTKLFDKYRGMLVLIAISTM